MEILNWQDSLPGEKTIATFDIYLGPQWGVTFKRWRLIRGKKGNFLGGPSYGTDDGQGGKKYYPYIEFSQEKKQTFEQKVLELIKPFLNERGSQTHDF